MPILDKSYISNLYYFNDISNNRILIADDFSETQEQIGVSQQPLIQGDIGIHVINVGGTKWATSINSPVFIELDGSFETVLDLIGWGYNDDNFLINAGSPNTILKEATVKISETGVQTQLNCWSDTSSIATWLVPTLVLPEDKKEIFYTRIARFYDTSLVLGNINPETYYIQSGEFTITANIKDNFFIRQSKRNPNPYTTFSLLNYMVKGTITVLYNPFEIESISKLKQSTYSDMFILNVAGREFNLSYGQTVIEKISSTIKTDTLASTTLFFLSTATK